MSKALSKSELATVVLRVYTLLKEIDSKSKELEELRQIVNTFFNAGDDVYISTRQKERVVLGNDFNRAVDSSIIEELAKSNPALKEELVMLAMDKVYDVTVGNFNKLLIRYPEIATAIYHKAVKPSLKIYPIKP